MLSLPDTVWNRITATYIAVSAAAGAASAHSFDDPSNAIMNRVSKAGLQLLGVACILAGLVHRELAVAIAIVLLLGDYVMRPAVAWAWRRWQSGEVAEPSEEQPSDVVTPAPKEETSHDGSEVVERRRVAATREWMARGQRTTVLTESSQCSEWTDKPTRGPLSEFSEWAPQPPTNPLAEETPPSKIMGAAGLVDDGDDVNPIVREGRIRNPLSGRTILIGKQRYKDLVEQGYTPNFKEGVLDRPSKRVV